MKTPVLYSHGGSKNHGCEAIVRTLALELDAANVGAPMLVSMSPSDDKAYDINKIADIRDHYSPIKKISLSYFKAYLMNKIFHRYEYLDCLPCVDVVKKFDSDDVAFSIGGDNYSYHHDANHTYLHNLYRKQGMKTILWACSINPELIRQSEILSDIKNFDCITARESITYNALLENGVKNVELIPDLAFILPRQECEESRLIEKDKYIGLNLSPMIIGYKNGDSIVTENYRQLIQYILTNTDYKICLIPHVIWESNDDRKAMQPLYDEFKETGRVLMIHDHNCMQLKDIIARCRFFIGARTHATIAAYSSCVPTFVLGYSVKARGIAKDLFGTEENYVMDVQSLKTANELTDAFIWMCEQEENIRNHYEKIMPAYIESVHKSIDVIKLFFGK